MPVPRTAEEAFTRYVLLRAVSPRGRTTPHGLRRQPPDQGSIQRALIRLVDQPEQGKLHPVDSDAAAVLYRATSEQAGRP